MTEDELQSWLLNDGVREELKAIALKTVSLEIGGLPVPKLGTVDENLDWSRLLLAGSILARSTRREMEEAALRIATAAVVIGDDERVRDTGAVLLEKLSNNRAVRLAEQRQFVSPGLKGRLGFNARVEYSRRSMSHKVLQEHSGTWMPVNDFQESFWEGASSDRAWLSVSAPTASGKTHLVRHWLVDQMLSTEAKVAVYIAPTRALVSEVEESLQGLISALEVQESLGVSSLPLKEKYTASRAGGTKVIFVFTQERLHLLANALGGNVTCDILVVDEAHKIGDGGRGVILQEAIERITRGSDKLRAVFISPATQNPEILLQDAPDYAVRLSVDSDVPTVLQNVITANQVRGMPTEWSLKLRQGGEYSQIGTVKLPGRPTTIKKKVALIAAVVGSNGGTLVYANGAAEAEGIALLISQAITKKNLKDQELIELAELARKGVHPQYQLAHLVECGVAFHYGNMPSLLRLEIERLFRSGKIKFLVCTSTLIEGVNLSCRTIVVRGPRKGKGHPMDAPDFWNLAGRAGRWGDEFQGNIICIDPQDKKAWPDGVPERARYPIKRETDEVISREVDLESFLTTRLDMSSGDVAKNLDLEQVSSYLLATYVRDGSISNANFARRHDADYIRRLENLLADVVKTIEVPVGVVIRHPGVSPVGLQRLLEYFRSTASEPEDLVPVPPESDDAYERFTEIMAVINKLIYPAFSPETLIPLHALIVIEWLKGLPLNYMIQKRLAYHARHRHSVQLGKVIRGTMELVEQTARFKAPKYLSAYVDVLKIYLDEIGKRDVYPEDLDIAIALEFGVSTRTMLSLMELGLSRMSAVALNERILRDDLDKAGCVVWILDSHEQFEGMDIPASIIREIRSKLHLI